MRERPRNNGRFAADPRSTDIDVALARFRRYCRHEPETGCVVWTGGRTMGRGHHVPYPAFWFAGRRWFGHRWAAKYIHGLDIDMMQVDHCCPNIPTPNTLCVEHLQALTLKENRDLQTIRRRMVYLQVGLEQYEDYYGGPPYAADPDSFDIPFYPEPGWLKSGDRHDHDHCPF